MQLTLLYTLRKYVVKFIFLPMFFWGSKKGANFAQHTCLLREANVVKLLTLNKFTVVCKCCQIIVIEALC